MGPSRVLRSVGKGFPVQAILFDLDGVLADSATSINTAWRTWADASGTDWSTLASAIPGRKAIDTIRAVLSPGMVDDSWIHMAAAKVNALQVRDAWDTAVFPGVSDFYRSLEVNRLAVVTSAPRELAVARLRRRQLSVPDVLVSAEDVTRGKPDPEGWLKALMALEVSASECIAVEDAPVGVISAAAAGLRVVALTTTHSSSDLSGADWIVGDGCQLCAESDGEGVPHVMIRGPLSGNVAMAQSRPRSLWRPCVASR